MKDDLIQVVFAGTLVLSDDKEKRTCGNFNKLITENKATFQRYFGSDLFAGSLNVEIPKPASLQADLDAGKYKPALTIPKAKLVGMPRYIGDGQAWIAKLNITKSESSIDCWIFRRIGSRVPRGIIEIVATEGLRTKYDLRHGDFVDVTLFASRQNDQNVGSD